MPRYFFDVRDDERLIADDAGVEFADLEAARHEAATALAEMAVPVLPSAAQRTIVLEVRREDGKPLLRLSLAFQVEQLRADEG